LTKKTLDLLTRLGVEIVEWISIILKENRSGKNKKKDSKNKKKSETSDY